jgi:hypothetical protein
LTRRDHNTEAPDCSRTDLKDQRIDRSSRPSAVNRVQQERVLLLMDNTETDDLT